MPRFNVEIHRVEYQRQVIGVEAASEEEAREEAEEIMEAGELGEWETASASESIFGVSPQTEGN